MTQLLISVKNVAEAQIALDAGADIIDLKDPNIGALGALDVAICSQIVQAIHGRKPISATVGEQHTSLNALIADIEARATIGVDIIKIAVSSLFYAEYFVAEVTKLSHAGVKIVAVFFVDEEIDFGLLTSLQKNGFYGAMLDTKMKQFCLLELQPQANIGKFVDLCKDYDLKSGLAGSLKPQHIESLMDFNSTYIGFRGGVCENNKRNSNVSSAKIKEVKNMLREHNKIMDKPQKTSLTALHS
jgi:(5-formylfuran-3-yl)methyl phosphate synthase